MNSLLFFFTTRIKYFISAILWQIPWFGLFASYIWYAKTHLTLYLTNIFELSIYEKNAVLLQQRTNLIYETLSMTNPLKYADYIAAVSASTYANARVATIHQMIQLSEAFLSGCLTFIWYIGCFYLIVRIIRHYREKVRENALADTIIAKLRPLLIESRKKQVYSNPREASSSGI